MGRVCLVALTVLGLAVLAPPQRAAAAADPDAAGPAAAVPAATEPEATPLPPPQWVSAVDVRGKTRLTWIANPAFVAVRVYRRRADGEQSFTVIGQTAENGFEDTQVEPGASYRYRLTGVGADGREGRPSAETGVRVSTVVHAPPTTPALDGYLLLEDGVGLKWAVREGEEVIAFNVYRRTLPGGEFTLIGSTQGTSFRDAPLQAGRTYEYALSALGPTLEETPLSPGLAVAYKLTREAPAPRAEADWVVRRTRLVALVNGGDVPFLRPADVAAGPVSGNLYLADSGRRRVFVFSPQGIFQRSLGVGGDGEGVLANVLGLGTDADENLLVVEAGAGAVQVLDATGRFRSRLEVAPPRAGATTGLIDAAARPDGGLAVVDNLNHRVALASAAGELRSIGQAGGNPGQFSAPTFCAVDGGGNLYVADALNARVQVFSPQGEFVRSFGRYSRGPGGLGRPKGVAVSGAGEVYVADSWLNTVQVFDADGRFAAVLGDEAGNLLDLGSPNGVALGRGNLIAIAERLGARLQIREILGAR